MATPLINPALFDLVPDFNRTASLLEQTRGARQTREQSAELQPLRIQQQEQVVAQQQQQAQQEQQQAQQEQQKQQFLQTELLPLIQNESIIKKMGKIEQPADQRKFLRQEAGKMNRQGNTQAARDLFELSQDTDENIRLASTGFADAKRGALEQGIAMGIPGLERLTTAGQRKRGFAKGEQFVTVDDGQRFLNTPIVDSNTGAVTIDKQPIGDIVSKTTGETVRQKTARLIREAGGRENAKLLAQIENASALEQRKVLGRKASEFRADLVLSEDILEDIKQAELLLEQGDAFTTGPIAGILPSFRDISQQLGSILKKLGLKRLASFKGATSERELKVAFESGAAETLDKAANLALLEDQRRAVRVNMDRIKAELDELESIQNQGAGGVQQDTGVSQEDFLRMTPEQQDALIQQLEAGG